MVVSPLVSMMVDQVSSIRSRGISDTILNGNLGSTLPMKETSRLAGIAAFVAGQR